MQLFKAFMKIARKRLPSSIIYFVVYAIIAFSMGEIFQENLDANFQSKALKICIIDEDCTEASQGLTEYLASLHEIVELGNEPGVLQDNLYYRYINYILTIPSGFEAQLKSGEITNTLTNVKVPGSTAGLFVDQQIDQYMSTLQLYMAGGYSLEQALAETANNLENCAPTQNIGFEKTNKEERKEVFFFYRYHPYIFILLLFCGLAPILIIFQKKEISDRTTCSALRLISRNIQLSLGCITYSLVVWIGFLLLGILAYGKGMFTTNALYCALNSFVFLLISAGLTLLISVFAPGMNAINAISNIIGLGMSFFCGVFVEQYMLPDAVLRIARFLPAYWYIKANDMISGLYNTTFDLSTYWQAIGIQLLFVAAIFAITLAAVKIRKQKMIA